MSNFIVDLLGNSIRISTFLILLFDINWEELIVFDFVKPTSIESFIDESLFVEFVMLFFKFFSVICKFFFKL